MFIATANVLDQIPGPLRDRMEIINLSGYTQEEKLRFLSNTLFQSKWMKMEFLQNMLSFMTEGVVSVIDGFTREAGLRNLERQIGSLCRKVAKKVASGEKN
jgi:ATP-dependent Lon protease